MNARITFVTLVAAGWACSNVVRQSDELPHITAVTPATWVANEPTSVHITGSFLAHVRVNLDWPDRSTVNDVFSVRISSPAGSTELTTVVRVNDDELRADAPPMSPGVYSVTVTDPRNRNATSHDAIRVQASQVGDSDAHPDGGDTDPGDPQPDGGPGDPQPDGSPQPDGVGDSPRPGDPAPGDDSAGDPAPGDDSAGDPAPGDPPAPELVYEDDFSVDDDRYVIDGDYWTVGPDELTHTEVYAYPSFVSLSTNTFTAPATATVSIRAEEIRPPPLPDGASTQLALLLLPSGAPNCTELTTYVCLADYGLPDIKAGKLEGGCPGPGSNATPTPPLNEGVTYTLAAWIAGNVITCEISGGDLAAPVQAAWVDTGTPITSGSVGFGAANLHGHFDDVEVWEQ